MTAKTAPKISPETGSIPVPQPAGATGQFIALGASFNVGTGAERSTGGTRDLSPREHEYLRMLKTLLANIDGIVYRCRDDAQHTLEFASQGCRAVTGYDVSQLLHSKSVDFESLKHPDDQMWVAEATRLALQERRAFDLEYRLVQGGRTGVLDLGPRHGGLRRPRATCSRSRA